MGNSASEKTEEATPKRKRDEREKGNIAKSTDMISALMLTVGIVLMFMFSKKFLATFKNAMHFAFTNLDPRHISTDDIYMILGPYTKLTANTLLPFLIIMFFATILIVRFQVGQVFATSKLKPDFEKLAPSKALQKLKDLINPVKTQKLVELAKSLVKLLIVGLTGLSVINSRIDELFGILGLDITAAFGVIGSILSQMLTNMCLAMLVIGILDWKYQSYEFNKSLKMTKQEVKEEFKNMEGDPQIKSKVRSIQMQMTQQRMMSAIPTADVVVTNPTHFAVAIKYDRTVAPAPIVVAKGADFVAFKIREVAQNNGVPIVENKPVARSLYASVPIDGIIPSDMFVAVAEILAYVYNKRK